MTSIRTMETTKVENEERIFTAIQYIYLPQLKEYIFIFVNNDENEPLQHNFNNRDQNKDQGIIYYFGSITGKQSEMPDMIKEMINDMDRDLCSVRRYVIAEFKNSAEISDYIEKMQEIQKSNEKSIIDETYNIIKAERIKQLEKQNDK